ncbi:hypothetical protein [Cupriavidus pauculus]|uniref:hypothetical protein n=1 Tax=Cupriavidus pauculus TaxID=82633 RepID=UPI001EE33312|nr:hypothetical protein [Cupriavidus pauculus]GJG95438.1 hypothetical protein CBA19C6_13135 [Cupriavidus pauculus]
MLELLLLARHEVAALAFSLNRQGICMVGNTDEGLQGRSWAERERLDRNLPFRLVGRSNVHLSMQLR